MGRLDFLKDEIEQIKRKAFQNKLNLPDVTANGIAPSDETLKPRSRFNITPDNTMPAPVERTDNSNLPVLPPYQPETRERIVPDAPRLPPVEGDYSFLANQSPAQPSAANADLPPVPAYGLSPDDGAVPPQLPIGRGASAGLPSVMDSPQPTQISQQTLNTPNEAPNAAPGLPEVALPPSQNTQNEINAINNKKYGLQRNEDGSIKRDPDSGKPLHEKDHDKDYDWKDVLGGLGMGILKGLGSGGGVLGGAVEGIRGALDRNYIEKNRDARDSARLQNQYGMQSKMENDQIDRRKRTAEADYATIRPDLEMEKINNKGREIDQRDTANKMRVVASMVNRQTDFDPDAPENADVVQMMRELKLPVFKKDASRQVKYIQDEQDGAMFVITTNKQTGETVAQQIAVNGQPLKITTRAAVGMQIKELDRASQEQIAAARNKAMLEAAQIGAGSREKVANINQAGAASRTEITQQGADTRLDKTLKGADDRQKAKLVTDSLDRWKQQFNKRMFRLPNDQEIEAARKNIETTVRGGQ